MPDGSLTDNDRHAVARTRELAAAEVALREQLFSAQAHHGKTINVWKRPEGVLRARRSYLWSLFPKRFSRNWQRPSLLVLWICARAALGRGYFNVDYSRQTTGQQALTAGALVRQYLKDGWRSGHDPSPLFDIDYYCEQAFGTSVADAPGSPLLHYLLIGSREGLTPHPLFDARHYRDQLPARIDRHIDHYSHYLNCGWRHNLDPHWAFSVHWYLRNNAPARDSGADPLSHYLTVGDDEGRSPHPFFDRAWYRRGRDVTGNTLIDFVLEGAGQGVPVHPLIDVDFLQRASSSSDVSWFEALVRGEGNVCPNEKFSFVHYRILNPDVPTNPLLHYIEFGWAERRKTHALFDPLHVEAALGLAPDEDPLACFLGLPDALKCATHPMIEPDQISDGAFGFDADFYRAQIEVPVDWSPLEHYLLIGRQLGIFPCPAYRNVSLQGWLVHPGRGASSGKPGVLLVAHTATGNLFGGERSFLDLVEGMHATGLVDVFVVLPQDEPTYVARILPFAVRVFVRPYPWWEASQEPDANVISAFDDILSSCEQIAVVHTNTSMLREPLIAARQAGRKAVIHVREIIDHDAPLQERIGLGWQDIVESQRALADIFICNSVATQRLFPERSFVVPNTIDVAAFAEEIDKLAGVAGDHVNVGMISSNVGKKGIGDFIELARSVESVPDLSFVLVGPDTPDLAAFIKKGLPSNLKRVGYVSSPARALARLDVIVNLSHFAESFGRTILEAMAAGRPVVVYDHGALPSLVEHERTGYVVSYRDINAARSAVLLLAESATRRQEMGESGRELAVKRFDKSRYVDNLRATYEKILSAR